MWWYVTVGLQLWSCAVWAIVLGKLGIRFVVFYVFKCWNKLFLCFDFSKNLLEWIRQNTLFWEVSASSCGSLVRDLDRLLRWKLELPVIFSFSRLLAFKAVAFVLLWIVTKILSCIIEIAQTISITLFRGSQFISHHYSVHRATILPWIMPTSTI